MTIEIRTTVWEIEIKEILVNTEVRASAHSSRDSESERPTKVVPQSRKHNIYTHFPKKRNCDICLRTKITRALCRTHIGEAVPRAEEFGDLPTADHTVLNEDGESRNNLRHAVVVLDLATQGTQSYIYHGIIELQHLIDPRHMALMKEPYEE